MNSRIRIALVHEKFLDSLVGQSRTGSNRKAGAASPFGKISEVAVFAAALGYRLGSAPPIGGGKTKHEIRYEAMKSAAGAVELIDALAFVELGGDVDVFRSGAESEAKLIDAFNRYCHGGLLWLAQLWQEKAIGADGEPHGNYTAHDLIMDAVSQKAQAIEDVYEEHDAIPTDSLLKLLAQAKV